MHKIFFAETNASIPIAICGSSNMHTSTNTPAHSLTMQIDGAGRVVAPIEDHHARGGHDRFVVLEFFLFLSLPLITHRHCCCGVWEQTDTYHVGRFDENSGPGKPSDGTKHRSSCSSAKYTHTHTQTRAFNHETLAHSGAPNMPCFWLGKETGKGWSTRPSWVVLWPWLALSLSNNQLPVSGDTFIKRFFFSPSSPSVFHAPAFSRTSGIWNGEVY